MPSDDLDGRLLGHLGRPLDRFRSALALTIEQVRGMLDAVAPPSDGAPKRERAALGAFAGGHIDVDRFAALLGRRASGDAATHDRLQRVFATLVDLAERGDALLTVRVEPGGSLPEAVGRALAEVGRAFAAARLVAGGLPAGEDGVAAPGPFPYARWSARERELAPPLIVHVDGADLFADGLARYLDGGLDLVLVVRGPAPPAPLARLVTPSTFVLQTADEADVAALARWRGPGVAALLPEDAARFVHDPSAGGGPGDRLTLHHLPEAPPVAACGGRSVRQQAEELAHLAALASGPAAAGPAPVDGHAVDPVDALAAWLLDRARSLEAPAP